MNLSFLPHVNAALNTLATILLLAGWVIIRRDRVNNIRIHQGCMISAFAVSSLFLVLYVTHKVWRAAVESELHTTFNHPGAWKALYLLILFTHLALAMTVPVFAIRLMRLGLTRQYDRHRRLARIGFPIWLYVSITGVVIYFMLYHFNAPVAG